MSCGRAGRRRIAAGELQHVGPVDARRVDADEQLARARRGVGMVLDGDLAVADRGGSHRARCYSRRARLPVLPLCCRTRDGVIGADGRTRPHIPFGACRTCRRCGASRASAWRLRSCCAARSGAARAWLGRGPAGAAVPGFMAGDGTLATMTRWLRVHGYRHAAGRHPSQHRVLGGGVRAARGAPRRRSPTAPAAGGDHRPEPRRRARPGGRGAAPRPGVRDRDAGRAVGVDAARAPARPAAGRRARRARHRPRAGPVLHELPARARAAGRSGRTSRRRSRRTSATSRSTRARTGSSTGARAWTRAPTSSSRSAPRTAAWRSTRAPTCRSPARWPCSPVGERPRRPRRVASRGERQLRWVGKWVSVGGGEGAFRNRRPRAAAF